MGFSKFLNSRRSDAKALVAELRKHFRYVSVLGADIKSKSIRADRNTSSISSGRDTECGFVVKMSSGSVFFEYSLDDISGDIPSLAQKIVDAFQIHEALRGSAIGSVELSDEPLAQSFGRSNDFKVYPENQLLNFCKEQCAALLGKCEYVLNAVVMLGTLKVTSVPGRPFCRI